MAFFKRDGDNLLKAPRFVLNKSFELRATRPADRLRVVNGWQWFDTAAAARVAYGLPALNLRTEYVALHQAEFDEFSARQNIEEAE